MVRFLQIDAWFVRGMSTRDGVRIDFEDVFAQSHVKQDPTGGARIRIPSMQHMIQLKQVAPKPRAKDEEDIAFLRVRLAIKRQEAEEQ